MEKTELIKTLNAGKAIYITPMDIQNCPDWHLARSRTRGDVVEIAKNNRTGLIKVTSLHLAELLNGRDTSPERDYYFESYETESVLKVLKFYSGMFVPREEVTGRFLVLGGKLYNRSKELRLITSTPTLELKIDGLLHRYILPRLSTWLMKTR